MAVVKRACSINSSFDPVPVEVVKILILHFANALVMCIFSINKRSKIMPGKPLQIVPAYPCSSFMKPLISYRASIVKR